MCILYQRFFEKSTDKNLEALKNRIIKLIREKRDETKNKKALERA